MLADPSTSLGMDGFWEGDLPRFGVKSKLGMLQICNMQA
jgi:hypothetical protein